MPSSKFTNQLVTSAQKVGTMNQVAIVQFLRLDSQRLPGKVMRKVGQDSLLEIGIRKLAELAEWDNNIHPIYICPEYDLPIINILDKYGVEYYLMRKETASKTIWPELIQPYLFYLKDYEVVWDINLICHPFMSLLSLREISDLCHQLTFSFTICLEKRNTLWDQGRHPLLGHNELANTKRNPIYLEPAHIAYVWKQEHLACNEQELANIVVPVPMEFLPEELIDIDTVDDLRFANRICI